MSWSLYGFLLRWSSYPVPFTQQTSGQLHTRSLRRFQSANKALPACLRKLWSAHSFLLLAFLSLLQLIQPAPVPAAAVSQPQLSPPAARLAPSALSASCPWELADCARGEVTLWAASASSSPPPRDLVAANFSALVGQPSYVGPCLAGPPSSGADQRILWSLASGDVDSSSPAQTTLTVTFSSALYALQVEVAVASSRGDAVFEVALRLASGGSRKVACAPDAVARCRGLTGSETAYTYVCSVLGSGSAQLASSRVQGVTLKVDRWAVIDAVGLPAAAATIPAATQHAAAATITAATQHATAAATIPSATQPAAAATITAATQPAAAATIPAATQP
ncbi:hypothetical protein PLESTB_001308400 [Pleodorina starrii]|uniref:Uncharacterized protein n=1 Tax=Pleodorina starrii TaxID=330485 RepID=A0A9W6BV18_9CHLO|nr:hypothetical protein PLESTB_001308400 [Pleodorina starrii]